MSAVISYRRATIDDQRAIWRVRTASMRELCKGHYGESLAHAWAAVPPPDDFAGVIGGREFLVAEHARDIVGFGFLNQQTAEVEGVFVAPGFSGQGVGKAILASLETAARQAGLTSLALSASLNAVGFYGAAGYRAVAETTWRHPAGFELPCVAMAKEL